MLTKQLILESIQRMPEDVTVDQAIDALCVLRKIEIGLQQLDAGDSVSHAVVFERFLGPRTVAG